MLLCIEHFLIKIFRDKFNACANTLFDFRENIIALSLPQIRRTFIRNINTEIFSGDMNTKRNPLVSIQVTNEFSYRYPKTTKKVVKA